MSEEMNPDTNFKVIDKRSPETQARAAEMPESEHIGDANEMALKPCPFCGENAFVSMMNLEEFWVVCLEGCGFYTPHFKTESDAIAAWNRRTPEPVTSVVRWVKCKDESPPADSQFLLCLWSARMQKYSPVAYIDDADKVAWRDDDLWAELPVPPQK